MHTSATVATTDYIDRLPKIEFHCHLEGSVPATTALQMARRNGTAMPTTDPDHLYDFASLEEFLAIYVAVCNAMARPTDFATATYDSLADGAASANLRYREIAFNPTNHPGVALADMVAAMSEAADAAERDLGVRSAFIAAINREHSPDSALDMVREIIALDNPRVVAIGMDHNELLGPPAAFRASYEFAAAAGLSRTAHAGERGNTQEISDTVRLLGAERIDHGYAVLGDPGLVADCIDRGTHFAACWSTAGFHADTPGNASIAAMIGAGLPVSISSDDPPMLGTDIGREYAAAFTAFQWTTSEIRQFVLDTASASFLPADRRNELVASLAADLDALDADPAADGQEPRATHSS